MSPSRRMISPTRPSSPTLQMSYMRAPSMPLAITAGPAIFWIAPWIIVPPFYSLMSKPMVFLTSSRM